MRFRAGGSGRLRKCADASCCPWWPRQSHSDHRDIMSLAGLLSILNDDPNLHDILARPGGAGPDQDLVAPPPLRPVIAAALAGGADGNSGFVLAVTATAAEADELAAGLASFLPPESIATFPGWE